ncbi:hypothetical protein [Leucobacter ruminantium]|uniref:Uncharacterized protein n=1 Tax=Leucobacter ruminantium TaxID=1289170 RepID=A0A939M2V7_9MICO|nr:hypothetical protein [Leucobacter ruminantium]MBO1805965.1 hypothetical protein [Leucobacter ruminantium]
MTPDYREAVARAALAAITSDTIDTPQNTLCLVRDAVLEQPAEVRGAFLLDVLGITLTYLGATLEAYCTETGAHIEDLLADFGRQQEEQIRKGL